MDIFGGFKIIQINMKVLKILEKWILVLESFLWWSYKTLTQEKYIMKKKEDVKLEKPSLKRNCLGNSLLNRI